MITIPLDSQLDAKGNAQKYFDRYNKLKRTYEALIKLTEETKTEIEHLESISTALDIALTEDDLVQIKEELIEFGYIKRKKTDKKPKSKADRSTTAPPTAMIFMLEKIITRTMNSLSSLQPETTGGSMQKECLVPTSS